MTKPRPGLARRLFAASLWGPGGVSLSDQRVSGLLRVVMPRFYATMTLFGLFGFFGGPPALRATFGDPYAQIWSILVSMTAIVCLFGVAYPARWWRAEIVSAMFLNSLLLLYVLCLVIAAIATRDLGKASVAVVLFAVTELPWWQIQDVFRERKRNGWK